MSNSNNIRNLKIRLAIIGIQLCAGIALLASILTALPAYARAGTLIKCDFISTQQGPRYVGTYCVDFACQYTTTRVFTSYCPFSL
jgi:hypothetical protein